MQNHCLKHHFISSVSPPLFDYSDVILFQLVKDDFPDHKKKSIEPPAHMRVPPVTPLEERVTVYPTDKPVPRTTSGMIGWRSTEDKLKLEKYGKYANGKGGLIKKFKWPLEAIV